MNKTLRNPCLKSKKYVIALFRILKLKVVLYEPRQQKLN